MHVKQGFLSFSSWQIVAFPSRAAWTKRTGMRAILPLLICLILATTSVSSAVMHSEMQGSIEMVICADIDDSGPVTLRLDATGKPIDHHHTCPECLAALASAMIPAGLDWHLPRSAAQTRFQLTVLVGHGRLAPAAIARGPPAFV